MNDRFVPAIEAPTEAPADDAWTFAFRDRKMLVDRHTETARVPSWTSLRGSFEPLRQVYLGTWAGRQVYAAELGADTQAQEGLQLIGLRGLFGLLGDDVFQIAGRAIQIVDWDRDHQFCGRCGASTEIAAGERARRCPRCELTLYPRLAPAVIVLVVRRGGDLLLARSPHFPEGMYSTLAGFVEPGETLEDTVVREIREEVGVVVGGLRYFGSQPWPFPHSLMIGFTAEYHSGELVLDSAEIEDAGWFSVDRLPPIPPKISIARALIDAHLDALGFEPSKKKSREA